MLCGIVGIAVAARVSVPVPGSDVPLSLQTLAVLLVGILLGPASGSLSVLAYLGVGALGFPVFAEGASGARHLVGPTAGYLWAFVPSAAVAGIWTGRTSSRQLGWALVGMLLAHAVVLASGWVWLSFSIGPARAWQAGVQPFLLGSLMKSAVASIAVRWKARSGQLTGV